MRAPRRARLAKPPAEGHKPRPTEYLDVTQYPEAEPGVFELPGDLPVMGLDLRGTNDRPIWSVGEHKETKRRLAAMDDRFYGNADYACVWLR